MVKRNLVNALRPITAKCCVFNQLGEIPHPTPFGLWWLFPVFLNSDEFLAPFTTSYQIQELKASCENNQLDQNVSWLLIKNQFLSWKVIRNVWERVKRILLFNSRHTYWPLCKIFLQRTTERKTRNWGRTSPTCWWPQ